MDLLSILNSSNTGLLEGFCRLQNDGHSFSHRLVDLRTSIQVKMNFSFGLKNLGCYEVRVDRNDHEVLDCSLITGSILEPSVILRITIMNCEDDFGRFLAISRRY